MLQSLKVNLCLNVEEIESVITSEDTFQRNSEIQYTIFPHMSSIVYSHCQYWRSLVYHVSPCKNVISCNWRCGNTHLSPAGKSSFVVQYLRRLLRVDLHDYHCHYYTFSLSVVFRILQSFVSSSCSKNKQIYFYFHDFVMIFHIGPPDPLRNLFQPISDGQLRGRFSHVGIRLTMSILHQAQP